MGGLVLFGELGPFDRHSLSSLRRGNKVFWQKPENPPKFAFD